MAPRRLSARYLKALGSVVVKFQRLELVFILATGGMFGESARAGFVVASGAGYKALVNLFEALYLEQHPDAGTELRELFKHAKAISEDRDKYVHSHYAPFTGPTVLKTKFGRNKAYASGEITTAEELEGLSQRLDLLANDLMAALGIAQNPML